MLFQDKIEIWANENLRYHVQPIYTWQDWYKYLIIRKNT